MNKKDLVTAVMVAFCFTNILFAAMHTSNTQSAKEYDPWLDVNDDGKIDMKDIGYVIQRFGTSGTAINKTELLLELQARMDALNVTVMALEELVGQSRECQVITGTGTGVGIIEVTFSQAFPNDTTPKVFATAVLKADNSYSGLLKGMCVYPELISVTNTEFAVKLKEDVGGVTLATAEADIYYIAIGEGNASTAKHCAGIETKITSGNQITITFPDGMFASPPYLSATVLVMMGPYAGKTCYISSKSVSANSATLSLQVWDGAVWDDVGDGYDVQVSYTAVETP